MPTYVFPVQVTMPGPIPNAGSGQFIAGQMEEALEAVMGDACKVIVLQPVPGRHRRTSTDPD